MSARVGAIFRQNVRLLLGDPGPVVIFILTPLLVMAIMKTTQETILVEQRGFLEANGSEQIVPGFTVMFAFFWVAFIGRNFFAEHGWGTWERLQTSSASGTEIMLGKILPAFVIIVVQMSLLFALASLLFDLSSAGPVLALLVVAIPLITTVLAFSLALVAVCRTLAQLEAIANMSMILFAALGGALTPTYVLPEWAEAISPATPSYWATKAAEEVILQGDGLSTVLPSAGVLLAFTGGFAIIAIANFRFATAKRVEA